MNHVSPEEPGAEAYDKRRQVDALRRQLYELPDGAGVTELLDRLRAAEDELESLEAGSSEAGAVVTGPFAPSVDATGKLVDTAHDSGLLGKESTGLEASVRLRMAQVPTSIVHLFTADSFPLVSSTVVNTTKEIRRLRVTSVVAGYSASSVETVEIRATSEHVLDQLPTFFPHAVRQLSEITRASLNILVEDLDTSRVELNVTRPIWLLPPTTAPLGVMDPTTREMQDMARYLGAYVTPNAPSVQRFLSKVYEHHPEHMLAGYQGDKAAVPAQVRAVYQALRVDAGIHYVNSVLSNSLQDGLASQRVRLPSESLAHQEANCLDGTVLFASLLEAISLNPAIVLVPGHAFLAWESWVRSNQWQFVETTMLGSSDYDEAAERGRQTAERYSEAAQVSGRQSLFRLLSMRELRGVQSIYPME